LKQPAGDRSHWQFCQPVTGASDREDHPQHALEVATDDPAQNGLE